jgi:IK cytokine
MAELAAKYRDRAAERRDGGVPGAPSEGANLGGARTETEDSDNTGGAGASNTSGYRAVAPDVKSSFDAAERRKRMIQARTIILTRCQVIRY